MYVPVPVKRHRGEPGHTRDTHGAHGIVCEWHQFQGINVVIYSQHRQNFRACAGQLDYPPSIEHPRHLPRGRRLPGGGPNSLCSVRRTGSEGVRGMYGLFVWSAQARWTVLCEHRISILPCYRDILGPTDPRLHLAPRALRLSRRDNLRDC